MSRDIKGTSLKELNDGLERAIRRSNRNLQNEIKKAHDQAIDTAISDSMMRVNNLRGELSRRMDNANSQLASRIERTQRNLGAQMDGLSRSTNQRLVELDQRHTQQLNQVTKEVLEAVNENSRLMKAEVSRIDQNMSLLNQNVKRLETSVDNRLQQQQQQLDALRNDVNKLFEERNGDENYKLVAVGQALALLETIRERSEIKRFAPVAMQEEVALKENRLRHVNPKDITISDANELIDKAIIMENEARREQLRWEAQQNLTSTAVNALLRLMQDSMNLKIGSIYEGATELEDLQTDYWTHGAYKKVLEETKELQQRIDGRNMSISELKEAHKRIEELEQQSERLRKEAVERGILSESRVAVSNDILNTMLSQGWELTDDPGYMGSELEEEDAREGTFAVLKKAITGEELSIVILPEEKEDGSLGNKIIFHRNDTRIEAAGAFQARMEQIKREIEKSGHKLGPIGEPKCGGDGQISQLRNACELRKRGAAEKLTKTLNASR